MGRALEDIIDQIQAMDDELRDFFAFNDVSGLEREFEGLRKTATHLVKTIDKIAKMRFGSNRVDLPVDHIESSNGLDRDVKSPPRETNVRKSKRIATRSKAYDFLILSALGKSEPLKPVGLDKLERVTELFDPSRNVKSLGAKLHRWCRIDEFVEWADPADRKLTKRGIEKRDSLPKFLSDDERDAVNSALSTVFS